LGIIEREQRVRISESAGLSAGSTAAVDLQKQQVIGSVDTLKNQGFNPNSIVLLPEWNHPAGH
jgi:hypothetical protein